MNTKKNKKLIMFFVDAALYVVITGLTFVYAHEGVFDFKFWIGLSTVSAVALKAKLSGGKESLVSINPNTGIVEVDASLKDEDKKEGEE